MSLESVFQNVWLDYTHRLTKKRKRYPQNLASRQLGVQETTAASVVLGSLSNKRRKKNWLASLLFIFSVYCLNAAQMNFWEIVQQPQRNPDKGIAQMQIRGNLFTDYCCCQCSQIASFYLINYCIWCTCSLSLKAFTHRMRLFFKLLTGQGYFFTYFHIKLFYFLDQGSLFWTSALQKKGRTLSRWLCCINGTSVAATSTAGNVSPVTWASQAL